MEIDAPGTDVADEVTALWLDLAESQREHGSHVTSEANRSQIRERVFRALVDDSLFVARVEGDIVGFVMFSIEQSTFDQDRTRGLVENLYVVPEHRDEGIGSALLSVAEDQLAVRDAEAITLEVMANNEAARRFYREAGYEPHRVALEKPAESDTHTRADR